MPDVDNQIGVFLTLEAVFPGDQPSLDSLKDLLKDLNMSEVIGICSRLNLSISDHLNEEPEAGSKGTFASNENGNKFF